MPYFIDDSQSKWRMTCSSIAAITSWTNAISDSMLASDTEYLQVGVIVHCEEVHLCIVSQDLWRPHPADLHDIYHLMKLPPIIDLHICPFIGKQKHRFPAWFHNLYIQCIRCTVHLQNALTIGSWPGYVHSNLGKYSIELESPTKSGLYSKWMVRKRLFEEHSQYVIRSIWSANDGFEVR